MAVHVTGSHFSEDAHVRVEPQVPTEHGAQLRLSGLMATPKFCVVRYSMSQPDFRAYSELGRLPHGHRLQDGHAACGCHAGPVLRPAADHDASANFRAPARSHKGIRTSRYRRPGACLNGTQTLRMRCCRIRGVDCGGRP